MLWIFYLYYTRELKRLILCKTDKNPGSLYIYLWKNKNALDNQWNRMVSYEQKAGNVCINKTPTFSNLRRK